MTTKTNTKDFVQETMNNWYSTPSEAKEIKTIDYKSLADNLEPKKFGTYTINLKNPTDFEKYKVFIPDLSHMEGKKLWEVGEYVQKTYGKTHIIPGIEFWEYLQNNSQIIENKKDYIWYYLFGSSLCDSRGSWSVPSSRWSSGRFYRDASWLEGGWYSCYRVLLLVDSCSLNSESLNLESAIKMVKENGYQVSKII